MLHIRLLIINAVLQLFAHYLVDEKTAVLVESTYLPNLKHATYKTPSESMMHDLGRGLFGGGHIA